jgi:type II secretory pathway component GspD/PulD (secretin)
MRTIAAGFLTTALFASVAVGQPPAAPALERVFQLSQTDTAQNVQEVTNVVRAMSEATATADQTAKSVSVHGTSAQIALAEWLLSELEQPAASGTAPATHPYTNARGQEEVVRVFSLGYLQTPAELQQLINLVRSMSDMQRVFPYNSLKLLVARGSADQIALADWLIRQLDHPAVTPAPDTGTREIQVTPTLVRTVRVFYLSHNQSPQDIQGIIDQLRTTGTQRIYHFNAQKAVAVAGTADQVTAAENLVRQLDQTRP